MKFMYYKNVINIMKDIGLVVIYLDDIKLLFNLSIKCIYYGVIKIS